MFCIPCKYQELLPFHVNAQTLSIIETFLSISCEISVILKEICCFDLSRFKFASSIALSFSILISSFALVAPLQIFSFICENLLAISFACSGFNHASFEILSISACVNSDCPVSSNTASALLKKSTCEKSSHILSSSACSSGGSVSVDSASGCAAAGVSGACCWLAIPSLTLAEIEAIVFCVSCSGQEIQYFCKAEATFS
jgi:hypothetical protein